MSDLATLKKSLLELDNHLSSCMRCGNCQAVCPIFKVTVREADVARGKIVLLQNLAYEFIKDPDAVEDRLNRCLLCGACQDFCSSGVQTLEIFVQARKILVEYKGLSPIKKLIFRILLAKPNLFAKGLQVGSIFQGIVVKKENNKQHTAVAPLLNPFLGKRHIPTLPKQQLSQKYGEIKELGKEINVIIYPGCMLDKIYTHVGDALIKILRHYNVGIYMPTDFACCGMPALASGDVEGFKKLLTKNMEVLKQSPLKENPDSIDYILHACPSCAETMHKWWSFYGDEIVGNDKDLLDKISHKSMEIHQFLHDILNIEDVQNKAPAENQDKPKVTYHESCHMKRSLHIEKQPRALLKQSKKYNFVELPVGGCCGCGGSFTLTQPELSVKIGTNKRNAVIATGAEVVATACPACMLQISDMLARNNDSTEVKHSIELIADSL